MARVPKTGLAKRIREVLRERFEKRPFRPKDVAEVLGIPPGKEREKVSMALKDFRARGEVVRLKDGRYRYVGGELGYGRKPRFKLRIARAIYYQKVFTVVEVACIAQAKTDTVRRFILRQAKEFIEEIGVKREKGQVCKVYKLVREDEFYRKFVLKEEEKWQS